MKSKLIISFVLAIMQVFIVLAQREPSKEILVFFSEGISHKSLTINGKSLTVARIKNEPLKTALMKIGIAEDSLEAAMPRFIKSDTFKVFPDGLTIAQPDMTNLFRLRVPEGKSKQEIIDNLCSLPEVLYAESNGGIEFHAIPDDTRFGEQWGLRNTINPGADIHAEAAWDIYKGNSNNIIAIIDHGSDDGHVDLDEKIVGGDTGYGGDGHGIRVAGVAAAESNNNQGISGVDWFARIHPQRIDNASDDADIYQAIVDAVNYSSNVRVLNNSWGLVDEYLNPGRYSTTVRQAFAFAYKSNRVSVTSMGNHQLTHPGVVSYPAGFGNVIAVGATNNADVIWNSSAQGNHIDVSAPGVDILSTTVNGGYAVRSGTSYAAPHVSGIASLLKGFNTNLANDDIENIINLSADDRGATGFDNAYGFGRVNTERALNLLRAPNTLSQWSATSGSAVGSTGQYTMVFMGAPGLASAVYLVKRYEVRKTITFPNQYIHLVGVWGRGVFTTGWNLANPNFGEGFCEVVPGTLTSAGVTLRTYVYEVWSITGSYLGYYPKSPPNVSFAYTVLGVPAPTLSGPSLVCTSGATFTVIGLPAGASISWTFSSNLQSYYGGSNFIALRAIGNGSGWVQATITSNYGTYTIPQKTVWVGTPSTPISIIGFCCNGMEFGSESIYDFTVNYSSTQGVNQFNWVVSGGTILAGQGTQTITVKTWKVTGSQKKYFDVSVRVGNDCGWSSYLWRTGYIVSLPGPLKMFTINPNSANSEVTVSVSEDNSLSASSDINDEVLINNLKIVDSFGNIRKIKKFDSGQKAVTINVSDFQKGVYLIVVGYGLKEESHKLMIE